MTPQETVLEITLGIIKAQIESMERKIGHLERETITITRHEVSGYLERIRMLLRGI